MAHVHGASSHSLDDLVRAVQQPLNRPRRGRPDLLDAVAALTDIPVVKVDGRVAMAGDQPDLVVETEPIGRGRDGSLPCSPDARS
jgi:hypothetical protein